MIARILAIIRRTMLRDESSQNLRKMFSRPLGLKLMSLVRRSRWRSTRGWWSFAPSTQGFIHPGLIRPEINFWFRSGAAVELA